jgi:hypothetical protein
MSLQRLYFRIKIESNSQLLFYQILFFFFKELFSNPNSNSFMQASSSCYVHKVLLKNTFKVEKLFTTGLKHCVDFFKRI